MSKATNKALLPLPRLRDVIVMGHILHDWDLAEKKLLLERPLPRCRKGGAVIASAPVIDDERRENAFGLLMSLNMLIETPGGFDYTGVDCQAWMREAGFVSPRVVPLAAPDWMVIGFKPYAANPAVCGPARSDGLAQSVPDDDLAGA